MLRSLAAHLTGAVQQLGGRVDILKEIEGIAFVASITDQTLQTIDSAPWARDLLISAEKKISSACPSGQPRR